MQKRKFYLVCILLIFSLVVTACSSQDDSAMETTQQEKELTISWAQDLGDLNPHLYSSEMFAQDMLYEPLVSYKKDGTIEPCLAEDWEISADGKEYIFKLREDVEFSDGSPFNAEIAKKNFKAVLNNADRHKWLEIVNQLKGVEVIDEYKIKLKFKSSYYPVLQELSLIRPLRFLGEAAFPENEDTSQGIKEPIGTGPWVLSEMVKDEYAVFTKNEHYWGEKPAIDEIKVKIIPDGETRAMALERGEIDLIYGSGLISLSSFAQLRDSGNYKTKVSHPISTRSLVMNTDKGATEELEVRKAIRHAFDKDTMIEAVFYGVEERADTLFAPEFVPYADLGLKPYTYDLEKARELLTSAGWNLDKKTGIREKDGKALELDLVFDSNNNIHKSIAEVLQGNLQKVGIKLNLIGEESQSITQRQKNGSFNLIFANTWGAPYDPHSFVSSMRFPAHADYQAQQGLEMKEELDKKIQEVLKTTDEDERQRLYDYILGTLHEEAVYLPISYATNIAVYHDNISGVTFETKYEHELDRIKID